MKKKLAEFFESKLFKKTIFYLGILFFLLTLIIAIDPAPFLKFGYAGVFLFSLVGPSTLLFPALSQYMNIYILSFATASGMLFNDSVAFLIGQNTTAIFEHPKKLERIETSIRKFGPFALFFWSLIPFPYDLIGFIAGYSHLTYFNFAIPTFFGKFTRFILIGLGIISVFGKS